MSDTDKRKALARSQSRSAPKGIPKSVDVKKTASIGAEDNSGTEAMKKKALQTAMKVYDKMLNEKLRGGKG
jgi:hypothetical protein